MSYSSPRRSGANLPRDGMWWELLNWFGWSNGSAINSMPPSVVLSTLAIVSWKKGPTVPNRQRAGRCAPERGIPTFRLFLDSSAIDGLRGVYRTPPYAKLTIPSRDCHLGVSWSTFVHDG